MCWDFDPLTDLYHLIVQDKSTMACKRIRLSMSNFGEVQLVLFDGDEIYEFMKYNETYINNI